MFVHFCIDPVVCTVLEILEIAWCQSAMIMFQNLLIFFFFFIFSRHCIMKQCWHWNNGIKWMQQLHYFYLLEIAKPISITKVNIAIKKGKRIRRCWSTCDNVVMLRINFLSLVCKRSLNLLSQKYCRMRIFLAIGECWMFITSQPHTF